MQDTVKNMSPEVLEKFLTKYYEFQTYFESSIPSSAPWLSSEEEFEYFDALFQEAKNNAQNRISDIISRAGYSVNEFLKQLK